MLKGVYAGRKHYRQMFAMLLARTVYSGSVFVLPDNVETEGGIKTSWGREWLGIIG